ncbi:N-acetylneuraminate anomerase [soil metagenome]
MIVDRISNHAAFAHLPWFQAIQAYLETHDLLSVEPGRYEVDGDALYVIVAVDSARSDVPPLEAHRSYIDLQLTLTGSFDVLWKPLSLCTQELQSYEATADMLLMADVATTRIHLAEGVAAVFFPDDAHAPQPPSVAVRKAVFKIRVGL